MAALEAQAEQFDRFKQQFLNRHPEWMILAVQKDAALKRYKISDVPDSQITLSDLYLEGLKSELISYPGLGAIAAHEKARQLYDKGEFAEARAIAEYAHSVTGIDIHPGATIDPLTFIDHGTGLVIGEDAHIGKGTLLYHGVTLGAYGAVKKGEPRHPTIGNHVIISNSAQLLGNSHIGDGAKIGPGVQLVISNVGCGSVIGPGVRLEHVDVPDHVRVVARGGDVLLSPIGKGNKRVQADFTKPSVYDVPRAAQLIYDRVTGDEKLAARG